MIKEIDKNIKDTRKYRRILKYIIIIVSLLIIAFSIYAVMYYNFKKNTIDKFNDVTSKYNFKNNGSGIYSLDYGDKIYCNVMEYFPKLLDFKLDYEKDNSLFCTIITGEDLKDNNGNGSGWSSEVQVNFTSDGKIVIDSYVCEDRSDLSSSLKDSNGNECDYYSRIAHYEFDNDDAVITNIDFDKVSERLTIDKEILSETIIQGTSIYKDLYK
jgi:hypothetical protein